MHARITWPWARRPHAPVASETVRVVHMFAAKLQLLPGAELSPLMLPSACAHASISLFSTLPSRTLRRNSTGAARVMLLDTLHPTDDGWWTIGDPEGLPSTGPEVTP